jgi:hypothetical protein
MPQRSFYEIFSQSNQKILSANVSTLQRHAILEVQREGNEVVLDEVSCLVTLLGWRYQRSKTG